MAKSSGPRIRKTETSSKSEKAKIGREKVGKAKNKVGSPFSKIFGFFKRDYSFIKLPDNKLGRLLSKRVGIIPGFLVNAFSEIRQTTWPNRHETIRLSWAVFVFAIIFSIIVAALDFVLDKIFKSIILG